MNIMPRYVTSIYIKGGSILDFKKTDATNTIRKKEFNLSLVVLLLNIAKLTNNLGKRRALARS